MTKINETTSRISINYLDRSLLGNDTTLKIEEFCSSDTLATAHRTIQPINLEEHN